jgi:hypothetical protein
MRQIRALFILLAALLLPGDFAGAGSATLPDGAYEVVSRLELPHVERWAIDQITNICITAARRAEGVPIPVLSANNPFAECAAANFVADGASIEYDIVCPGRASAKAHASYRLEQPGFTGRVAMVMAAKNMTMTEIVRARRVGDCER